MAYILSREAAGSVSARAEGRDPARNCRESPRFRLALAALFVLALLPATAATGQSVGVFAPADSASAQVAVSSTASVDDGMTMRRRVVTVDFGMLDRAQASAARRTEPGAAEAPVTLALNLFDDTVFTALVERTAPTFSGGYSVAGRLAGEPLGAMTLVVNGETLAGTVRAFGGTYRIRSAGAGLFAISEVDLSRFPEYCEVSSPGAPERER